MVFMILQRYFFYSHGHVDNNIHNHVDNTTFDVTIPIVNTQTKHPDQLEDFTASKISRKRKREDEDEGDKKNNINPLNYQNYFVDLLVLWVVSKAVPFDAVSGEEFKNMIECESETIVPLR